MGIIQNIKGYLGLKTKSQTLTLTNAGNHNYFFAGLDGFSYNTRNAEEFVQNGYGRNPYVYAVVDRIADVSAGLPRIITDKDGGEIRASVASNAFTSLLGEDDELYHKIITSLLVTGNAFIYADSDALFGAFPGQLTLLLSQDVTIITADGTESGPARAYSVSGKSVIPAEDVLHIRFPNVVEDTNWGLSPLYSGQAVYTASNNTFTAKASILENRGVSGILSAKNSDMPIMPKDQQKLQANWEGRTAGADKFGGIHVTTAALDYLDIGMSSKDLELVQQNIENLRDVCRIYGVDSSLFGDPSNRTYSNQEQAKESFYTDVVLPLCQKVDKALGGWLLKDKFSIDGSFWGVDVSEVAILNKPKKELSDKVLAEVVAGVLPKDKALEMLYPEIAEEVANERAIQDALLDPAAMNANAEAQGNLRGSVGGVQGILAIQQGVSSGTTSRSAAIAMLIEIYGFTAQVAQEMLGEPTTQGNE